MPSTTNLMTSEMAVVSERFCFFLSGYLLTFQTVSVRIVSSGGIKISSRKIGENYLACFVRRCARSQEICHSPFGA